MSAYLIISFFSNLTLFFSIESQVLKVTSPITEYVFAAL